MPPDRANVQETESETAQFTQQVKLNSGMGLFLFVCFSRDHRQPNSAALPLQQGKFQPSSPVLSPGPAAQCGYQFILTCSLLI